MAKNTIKPKVYTITADVIPDLAKRLAEANTQERIEMVLHDTLVLFIPDVESELAQATTEEEKIALLLDLLQNIIILESMATGTLTETPDKSNTEEQIRQAFALMMALSGNVCPPGYTWDRRRRQCVSYTPPQFYPNNVQIRDFTPDDQKPTKK